jgi:hypothetical protein
MFSFIDYVKANAKHNGHEKESSEVVGLRGADAFAASRFIAHFVKHDHLLAREGDGVAKCRG